MMINTREAPINVAWLQQNIPIRRDSFRNISQRRETNPINAVSTQRQLGRLPHPRPVVSPLVWRWERWGGGRSVGEDGRGRTERDTEGWELCGRRCCVFLWRCTSWHYWELFVESRGGGKEGLGRRKQHEVLRDGKLIAVLDKRDCLGTFMRV